MLNQQWTLSSAKRSFDRLRQAMLSIVFSERRPKCYRALSESIWAHAWGGFAILAEAFR